MEISPYGSKDEESLDICRVEKSRRICVLKLLKITKVLIRYGFILFFSRFELRTVTVILWKSDKPVSSAHEFWKLRTEFVNNKLIASGLSGLLKHVGTLIKFFSLYKLQKSLTWMFAYSALKSPISNTLS